MGLIQLSEASIADQISIPHPPQSNTQAKAAEMKANLDAIVEESNKQDARLNKIESAQLSLYVNGERVGAVLNHFDRFNWWIVTDKGYAFKVFGGIDSPLTLSDNSFPVFLTDDCTGDEYEAAPLNRNLIYPVSPVVGALTRLDDSGQPFYFTYSDYVSGVTGYYIQFIVDPTACAIIDADYAAPYDPSELKYRKYHANDPSVTGFSLTGYTFQDWEIR